MKGMYVCKKGHLHTVVSPWAIMGIAKVNEDMSAQVRTRRIPCSYGFEVNQEYERKKKGSEN